MKKIEILFHICMIILMIAVVVAILVWCGEQAWILQELKNKCIAECVEINKINPFTCAC